MKNLSLAYKSAVFILITSFLFTSCSDSEDSISKSSLLANSWDVVKFQSKLPSESEWTDIEDTCTFDDTWDFDSSGEVIIYAGSVLCDGGTNANNTIYDYELAANDTKIIFTIGGNDYEEDIEELTENTLITTYARGTSDNSEGRRVFTKTQ